MMLQPIITNSDFTIFSKPHGMATVPLKKQDVENTLLGCVSRQFPEVMKVCGKFFWEGGAVHRLDTVTGGLVMFARKQSFYDYIIDLQKQNKVLKKYRACTTAGMALNGFTEFEKTGAAIESCFRSFGPGRKAVRPCNVQRSDNKRVYRTFVSETEKDVFECAIYQGFRHQIRAHLAWSGHPIINDTLYGAPLVNQENSIELLCYCIEFDGLSVVL